MKNEVNLELRKKILSYQKGELNDHMVYKRLSFLIKNSQHAEILRRISKEELTHYEIFKEITQEDIRPNYFKISFIIFVSRIFGLNFGLRLMEKGENITQESYNKIRNFTSKIEKVIIDETKHENELISLIDEERLKYASSMVLGLNDALVELSGALVGFTLALQRTKLVGIVGLITGIAASLSMASSEFLSTKEEGSEKNPLKASLYTGSAYVGTVFILILPYFIFKNIFISLCLVIINALFLIFIFTFYISISKGLDFIKRLFEMAGISLSVAIINFGIGLIIRKFFGIEI